VTIWIKGVVHFKKKTFVDNLLTMYHIHVFLSSVEKKLRFLMKTLQDFSPYNAL